MDGRALERGRLGSHRPSAPDETSVVTCTSQHGM